LIDDGFDTLQPPALGDEPAICTNLLLEDNLPLEDFSRTTSLARKRRFGLGPSPPTAYRDRL
jgi:hypothetical protein